MVTVIAPPVGERLILRGIDWRTYRRLDRILGECPGGLRLTYDRGTLEIMTTSPEHESYRRLLARFVDVLTEELNLPMVGYGSMTFRRPRRQGLEPDECYWITQASRMRGRSEIDFRTDPHRIWFWRSISPAARSIGWRSTPRSAWPRSGASMA